MKNSKLIQLLETFTSSELRSFKDFVSSPFFNKNEDNLRLYTVLKKLAPTGFTEEKLSRPRIFQLIYPDETYDEKKLNHLMSEVFQLAEQYIAYQEFQGERALPYLLAARGHLKRRQDKSYQYQARKATSFLEKDPKRDSLYYYQSSVLAELSEQQFSRRKLHLQDQSLETAIQHFDRFYLSKKLQYLCIMLDRQKFLPHSYEMPLMPFVMRILESRQFDSRCIDIYYGFLQALTAEQPREAFNHFRKLLSEDLSVFSQEERQQLYLLAINFCVHRIRIGQRDYAADLMALYTEGIEKSILLENGQLSSWLYKNVVKLGLGLGRLEWVEQFVRQYSHYLADALQEDAYHFSLADLYFHKKEYEKAFTELNKVEFSDIHYKLEAKATLLKIYYETDEIEAMLSLISTFKIFLIRQKKGISKYVRSAYMNFARFLLMVYKEKENPEKVREKINKTKELSDRSWLLHHLTSSNA
jgi:hypothetical protein